jgi:dTDP-6-deoxy-L-talose 4-dehydrogenase [NAD(P)+]
LHSSRTVLRAAREQGLDAVLLRLSNVVGAGTPPQSLLGQVAAQMLAVPAGQTARVQVSPLQSGRDFVHAQDVARAVVAAVWAPDAGGHVLNIASGASQHVRDMVHLLISISGRPVDLVERPAAQTRSAAADWMDVDVSAARTVLGWSPRYTARDMVDDLWLSARQQIEVGSADPAGQQVLA